jgi:hypothetical protein
MQFSNQNLQIKQHLYSVGIEDDGTSDPLAEVTAGLPLPGSMPGIPM